ncbi:MAG: glutamate--cysteine ligase [Pseudomonadales bacterium]|jgi:glutamate--cysteine ligase|tara:strand:- start:1734 stop:3323 length:1590 start_codon:yes stop_codon:yes gene_type:complete
MVEIKLDTQRLLAKFDSASLRFNRGIERETLRVDPKGNLSLQPHPAFLGSKLSHPSVTTDFSESQLELITPVSASVEETLETLSNTHRYVYSGLEDELIWSSSMPCVLPEDHKIPLAYYGESNLGQLKTTYRNGLGNRYGRSMQTICAVHYNFSFPDEFWQTLAKQEGTQNTQTYRTNRYFDVMRNFRRFSWLPIYLLGASPAVCDSFVNGKQHNLDELGNNSLYLENATSLRNGDLGYQSDAQSSILNICYNSLDNYVEKIANAVTTPYAGYASLQSDSNLLAQLNDSILQSEAEFYTTIRAKCVPAKGCNFLQALRDDGVEYIEVRLLDVDPYEPTGISETSIRFLDTLLLYCLLTDSPKHDTAICSSVTENVAKTVRTGRQTSTLLSDQGKQRELGVWGQEILSELRPIAEMLDQNIAGSSHVDALEQQSAKLLDPNKTPSGRILQDMKDQDISYLRFAMNQSIAHRDHFQQMPLSKTELASFEETAKLSLQQHQAIEAEAQPAFERYLAEVQAAYLPLQPNNSVT